MTLNETPICREAKACRNNEHLLRRINLVGLNRSTRSALRWRYWGLQAGSRPARSNYDRTASVCVCRKAPIALSAITFDIGTGPARHSASVTGGCAGALEAIRACHSVTRPNNGGRAKHMVRYKHHLRDARKRHGVDARRAGDTAGQVGDARGSAAGTTNTRIMPSAPGWQRLLCPSQPEP